MIYNLKKVTGAYVRRFCDYIQVRNFDLQNMSQLYDLFSYSLKCIYGFPPTENNFYIEQYGENCISYLKKTKGVPRASSRLSVEDRLSIIRMGIYYFVAVGMLNEESTKYNKMYVQVVGERKERVELVNGN